MSFTGFTGHGLLQLPEFVGTGPEAGALVRTAAQSTPLWVVLGLVVREIVGAAKKQRNG